MTARRNPGMRRVLRRDPPKETFEAAVKYLEEQGFKVAHHRFGPKRRIDLSWPDDRRGIRLPEWRVVEIAEAWKREREPAHGAAEIGDHAPDES